MAVSSSRVREVFKNKGSFSQEEIADLAGQLSSLQFDGANASTNQKKVVQLLTGGENRVSANTLGFVQGLTGQINDYYSKMLSSEEKKLQQINKNIKVSDYYTPLAETYNWGGGASGNRKKAALDPWMRISENAKALQKAQQAAQNFQSTGQMGPAHDAQKEVLKWYNNPTDQAGKSVLAGVQSYFAGTTSSSQKEEANAAAAQVGMPLPYPDAKVGNISSGSVINNKDIASGNPYDAMAAKAIQGKKPIETISTQNTKTSTAQGGLNTPNSNILSNPAALADFVKKNGITDLKTKEWWNNSPVKQQAWEIINGNEFLQQDPELGSVGSRLLKQLSTGISEVGNKPLTELQRKDLERNFQAITGKNSQAYLAQFKKEAGQLPSNIMEAQNEFDANELLNSMQSEGFGQGQEVETRGNNTSPLSSQAGFFQDFLSGKSGKSGTGVSPGGAAPAFSAEAKLAQLRDQYDVDPLEGEIASIDNQIQEVEDLMTANRFNEQGQPVALGVMAGRISQEEQQAMERVNFLNRKKAVAVQSLNNKYSVIDTVMKASQTDYQNAKESYDTKFNQMVTATNLLMGIDQAQKTDEARARDDARANIGIVANSLKTGGFSWDSLDEKQKSQYASLEMQAGLPTGTIKALSNQVDFTTESIIQGTDVDGNEIVTVLEKNTKTGQYQTQTIVTGGFKQTAKADIIQQGTYESDNGEEIAWTRFADGTFSKEILGKTKQSSNTDTKQNDENEKKQQELNNFVVDLIKDMDTMTGEFSDKPKLTYATAKKMLKAKYPTMTEESVIFYLGEDPSKSSSSIPKKQLSESEIMNLKNGIVNY